MSAPPPTDSASDRPADDELRGALARGGPDEFLRVLGDVCATPCGTIHWLGADGLLHLAAHRAIPAEVLERIQTIPIGKGMAGLALERAVPVTLCNLQTDTSGDARPGAKATGMGGSIAVPILSGERAIGVLGVAQAGEREYSEREIALLLGAGRLLARDRDGRSNR